MTACTVCRSPDTAAEPFYWLWRDRRFELNRCRSCTHQFVTPTVTAEDQAIIYGDAYFERGGDWSTGVFPGGYADNEANLITEAGEILTMLSPHAGRILDYGCAGGTFLDQARQRGWQVRGVELNARMRQLAWDRYGLHIDPPTKTVALYEDGQFDAVTILDVLEHIPQPADLIALIVHWIKPGGTLLIRGPLQNSRWVQWKEAARRQAQALGVVSAKCLPGYPLDVNAFSKRSLTTLLQQQGFQSIRWVKQTSSFANCLAQFGGT